MGRRRPKFIGRGTVEFPSLKTDKPGVAPLSNTIPKGVHGAAKAVKDIAVPDGYVIGHLHKSSPQLHPVKDLKYLGGRKPIGGL